MGLNEELADLKKQLEDAQEAEAQQEAAPVEEEPRPEPEPPVEEPVDQEGVDESEGEEEGEQEAAKKTPSDYARERREKKAEEKREMERLREEVAARDRIIEQLAAKDKPAPQADPEPNKEENYEGWLEWNLRKTRGELESFKETVSPVLQEMREKEIYDTAAQELVQYENMVRDKLEGYDEVSKAYLSHVQTAIQTYYPNANPAWVAQETRRKVLQRAAQYQKAGYNPVEALYHEAVEKGLKPTVQDNKKPDAPQPDLAKVAANRKRNAGVAAAKGAGGQPDITPEAAGGLTVAEWSQLPPEQKRLVLPGG
jgi:hypothetical protein